MPHFLIQLVPPKQAFSFNFGCFLSKFYSPWSSTIWKECLSPMEL
jgi:hypothetical protein